MLVCGGAKSYISNYENIPRNVTFGFSFLERSKIEGGDYIPKSIPKNTPKDKIKGVKEKINKTYEDAIDKFEKNNHDLYKALMAMTKRLLNVFKVSSSQLKN